MLLVSTSKPRRLHFLVQLKMVASLVCWDMRVKMGVLLRLITFFFLQSVDVKIVITWPKQKWTHVTWSNSFIQFVISSYYRRASRALGQIAECSTYFITNVINVIVCILFRLYEYVVDLLYFDGHFPSLTSFALFVFLQHGLVLLFTFSTLVRLLLPLSNLIAIYLSKKKLSQVWKQTNKWKQIPSSHTQHDSATFSSKHSAVIKRTGH